MTPDDEVVTAASTPEQLDLLTALPEYHGRKPVAMKTSLAGAASRVQSPHDIGDRVVMVIEAKVKKAGHEDTDDGLVYYETRKVVDMFEVEGQAASRLLAVMRQRARTLADAGKRTPIEGDDGTDMGMVGYTDSSGVVLTPAEVAEMRGDPAAAIVGAGASVVIVYWDGARSLWPSEFAADVAQPKVGDQVLDNGVSRVVAAILNDVTGETITADLDWTPDGFDPVPDIGDGVPDIDDWDAAPVDGDALLDLPEAVDFAFVDRPISVMAPALADVNDEAHLRRLLTAERQGRGKGAEPRKAAVAAIEARLAYVLSAVKLKLVKNAPEVID